MAAPHLRVNHALVAEHVRRLLDGRLRHDRAVARDKAPHETQPRLEAGPGAQFHRLPTAVGLQDRLHALLQHEGDVGLVLRRAGSLDDRRAGMIVRGADHHVALGHSERAGHGVAEPSGVLRLDDHHVEGHEHRLHAPRREDRRLGVNGVMDRLGASIIYPYW